jgi:large subunit ribosomal protein L23
MQALFISRRTYATTIPNVAAVARTASTPLAVRTRRAQRAKRALRPGRHDATPLGSTPTEHARYRRLLALGDLTDKQGHTPTEEEWLAKLNERRSRIRGVRHLTMPDGQKEAQVVGQKIYLPNIIFKMVRNHTPAGQPYNPYEATFRIPPSITKTDVRSYLHTVYGVKTTYIRTDNYVSPLIQVSNTVARKLERRSYKTYKRAVVGLVEPFYYPMALEDMGEKERAERVKEIEKTYGIDEAKKMRMRYMLQQTKSVTPKGLTSGVKTTSKWKWRGEPTANKGKILGMLAARRAARDGELEGAKQRMREARAQGKSVPLP